jgi:hypothetical protein
MKSGSTNSKKSDRKVKTSHAPQVSPGAELQGLIAKRAYECYAERGYRHGLALDDWLDAEREILSQIPPA